MARKKLGSSTVVFDNPPSIISSASIAGVKEGEGPLSQWFDEVLEDDMYDERTWEKAESKLQKNAVTKAIDKANLPSSAVDYIFSGDLLNQCAGSHYGLREMNIPFYGIFGACSTMAQSISLAAMTIDGGFADYAVAATSSHFCSAEKQFRYPLEYGGQRTQSAQWTVTGAGAALLAGQGAGPYVTHITTGKIVDMGITDSNNMGAAMAPAAVDTMAAHFKDTGFKPKNYDLIITGDLADVGKGITRELAQSQGIELSKNYEDCGSIVYYTKEQDMHSGGSGCGCSGIVFCGYILEKIRRGELKRVLFIGTGALMTPTLILQGESIPGIAHAVTVTAHKGGM